jgi:hypothetical protein
MIRIFSAIGLALVISLIIPADSAQARIQQPPPPQRTCADQPKVCKLPVKYLGEKAGCACFACEYGKTTQRVSCTKNKTDRAMYMEKVRQSMPKKAQP